MRRFRILAIGMFALTMPILCIAGESNGHLSTPARTMYVPNHIVEGSNTWNNWYWDGSHLIAYRTFAYGSRIPDVLVYDLNGQLLKEGDVWFDHAKRVTLGSVAMNRQGRLFVSGGTTSESGQVAQFIGEIDESGVLSRVVRTTPFIPYFICTTGDDDTVWAYGMERVHGNQAPYDHALLRHYSMSQGLLDAVLNRSALPSKPFPPYGWYAGQTNMRCIGSLIAIYNGPTDQLITYDVSTKQLRVVQVEATPKEVRWTGFAVTDDGSVFASFIRREQTKRTSGLVRLVIKPDNTASWIAVPGTLGPIGAADQHSYRLAGSDRNQLVYSDSRSSGRLLFANIVP